MPLIQDENRDTRVVHDILPKSNCSAYLLFVFKNLSTNCTSVYSFIL